MSLTLWHRQFRNPIFLVLWTCYSEVQLVTSAAVSLFGGATRCMNICVQVRSMGVEIPLQSTIIRGTDAEWLPKWLGFRVCCCHAEDYKILS